MFTNGDVYYPYHDQNVFAYLRMMEEEKATTAYLVQN